MTRFCCVPLCNNFGNHAFPKKWKSLKHSVKQSRTLLLVVVVVACFAMVKVGCGYSVVVRALDPKEDAGMIGPGRVMP